MSLKQRLEAMTLTPGKLGAKAFRAGSTSATTPSERSRLARLEAPAARALLAGPQNPFKLTLPAYESFSTDGTDGNTETFNLSNNLIDSKNTNSVVAYIGGTRAGPDSVDYGADSIDVTDPGSNNTVHVFYVTDAPGEVELVKVAPDGRASSERVLDSVTLHHVHRQDQSDQPHYLDFTRNIEAWVPEDFALEIYVTAEYTVALEDPDGDGAIATNALYQLPVFKGNDSVEGLKAAVRNSMQ